jgi:DNA-binding MarR family transcriptional regulator
MSATDTVEQLGDVLDLVGPLYRRAVRKLEGGEASGDLPVGVRAVLDLLRRAESRTVPQLAQTLGLSRQFMQRSVDEAQARGYVRLLVNPMHRRSSLVALTDSGRTAIEQQRARERDLLQRVASDVSLADVRACMHVLRRLLVAVSDTAAHPGS